MFMQQSLIDRQFEINSPPDAQSHQELTIINDPHFFPKDKQVYMQLPSALLNQSIDEGMSACQKEGSKKIMENRLKYKKIKQKLNNLSEQFQDQGLFKEQKDITSPNKSRLLKLAIELEKSVKTQATDYQLVQSLLKEIQKIVEHRREHDILILRGARLITTLLAHIKRFPTLHRNQALQSMASMELSLRLLRIVLSLSSSRQQLLMSNQMIAITSLLSCALMREQRKIAVNCLTILNLVISGPNKIELCPLLNASIEYILCSSLLKRLKSYLQTCLQDEDPSNSQFLLVGFKFYYLILSRSCEEQFQRPIYEPPHHSPNSLGRTISTYFESCIQLFTISINQLIYEKQLQGQQKYCCHQQQISNNKINILLYIFKSLNTIFHADIYLAQKSIQLNTPLLSAVLFAFDYTKNYFKETTQIKNLCSQIIIFIGNLSFQNVHFQEVIRTSGLLQALCNHPIDYIMEPLKHIFVPSLCCVIHKCPQNFKQAFAQNSVQPILQYIQKQINTHNQIKNQEEPSYDNCLTIERHNHCRTLSRKTSVSSINSSYSKASMAESFSTQATVAIGLPQRYLRLQHKYRPQYWQELARDLQKLDD